MRDIFKNFMKKLKKKIRNVSQNLNFEQGWVIDHFTDITRTIKQAFTLH